MKREIKDDLIKYFWDCWEEYMEQAVEDLIGAVEEEMQGAVESGCKGTCKEGGNSESAQTVLEETYLTLQKNYQDVIEENHLMAEHLSDLTAENLRWKRRCGELEDALMKVVKAARDIQKHNPEHTSSSPARWEKENMLLSTGESDKDDPSWDWASD